LPTDFGGGLLSNYSVIYANPNADYVLSPKTIGDNPVRLVVTPSTGETHIDRKGLEAAGITVLSLLDDREALEQVRASSEFTFFLILSALRGAHKVFLNGKWDRDEEELRGKELYTKMIGLIGHGRIGKNLENWLRAFGAGVYWRDPHDQSNVFQPSTEWIFRNCHVVVICCSLDIETAGMIRGDMVARMRPGAILVNTARGEILDEESVAKALFNRPDVSYWTDVLSGEATGEISQSPLLGKPNVHVTPHIAGTTFESQEKAARIALNLTKRWLSANGEHPAEDVRVSEGE